MAAQTLKSWWSMSSLLVKAGVILAALVLLAILIIGGKSWWENRAYEKREAQAVADRKEWLIERQALLNKIAASEALTEAAKKVVEAKRKDTLATIEELQQVEQSHEQTKEEIEQQIETGSTEPIDKLRRDMDDTLCKRGYKAFCPK